MIQYYKLQKKFTFGDLNDIIQPSTAGEMTAIDLAKVKLEGEELHAQAGAKSLGKNAGVTTE